MIQSWQQLGLTLTKRPKRFARRPPRSETAQPQSLPAPFIALILMPTLVVHHRAARYIQRLGARTKAQLLAKLEQLARDPKTISGIKPLAGEWAGFFRLRHGDLRVIDLEDKANDAIVIAHVGPVATFTSNRIRHGWTQTELARRSGIRLETISRIESGKHIPRQETLLKLDRALAGK